MSISASGVAAIGEEAYVTGSVHVPDLVYDAFLLKVDALGEEAWSDTFGATWAENDEIMGACLADGSLFFAGWTRGVFEGEASAGYTDAFLRRAKPPACHRDPLLTAAAFPGSSPGFSPSSSRGSARWEPRRGRFWRRRSGTSRNSAAQAPTRPRSRRDRSRPPVPRQLRGALVPAGSRSRQMPRALLQDER